MSRVFMWLRWPELVVLVFGVGLLAFVHSQPLLTWAYVDAVAASAEYRQSLTLSGIVAAAVAAWVGSKIGSPRVAFCPSGARRRGYPLALRQAAELAGAAVGGMLLGLVPVTVWAISGTSLGALDLGVVASGVACMVAFVTAGYLLGVLVSSLVAVPAAAALAYAWVVFTGIEGRVTSPVWPFDVVVGLHEPSDVTTVRIVYFLTVAGLSVAAAGWWLQERNVRLTPGVPAGVAMFLVPCVAFALVADSREGDVIERAAPAPSCMSTDSGVQVCVHSARDSLLTDLARQTEQIVGVLGPQSTTISEVADAALWRDDRQERVNLDLQTQDSDRWLPVASADIASVIAGLPACYEAGRSSAIETQTAASSAVAMWMLGQIDTDAATIPASPEAMDAVRRLDDKPAAEARQHVLDHLDELRSCSARVNEL